MKKKLLLAVVAGMGTLIMFSACGHGTDKRGFGHGKKAICCEHKITDKCENFDVIVEQLNLNEEQKKSFEKIKKTASKEIRKEVVWNFSRKKDHDKIINIVIDSMEKFENILDVNQKVKFREIILNKHFEKRISHMAKFDDMHKTIVEQLNLNEGQKLIYDKTHEELKTVKSFSEQLNLMNTMINSLSNEQQKIAFKLFIENSPKGKEIKTLNLTDKQLDEFIVLHKSLLPEFIDSIAKYEKGEQTLATTLKTYLSKKDKITGILNPEQLKTLETLKLHGHGRNNCK